MSEYILNVLEQTSKLDWAFPFQRTGAFPLDRSSVFSSLADAQAYAQGIQEDGSANDERGLAGVAYVGQPLSVYDNTTNSVTLYIIDTDRSLKEVGSVPVGDNASIEIVNNQIQLQNFGKTYWAYIPAEKDEDGNIVKAAEYKETEGFKEGLEPRAVLTDNGLALAWYEPGTETVEDIAANLEVVNKTVDILDNQVENLQNEIGKASDDVAGTAATGLYKEIEDLQTSKADASTVYTKTETDEAIGNAIAALDHLERIIVDSLDDIDVNDAESHRYIYMVPTGFQAEDDKYDEYIVINGVIEKVGSWEIDLSGYAKTQDVNNALNKKVDVIEDARLMTDSEGDKLAQIESGAEKNVINDASSEFEIDDNRTLSIKGIAQNKVSGLVEALTEIINDIEAANSSLEQKVTQAEGYRLISNEEIARLEEIKDLIQSVDTNAFTIDENGKLLLNSIEITEIEGLVNALYNKVDKVEGQRLITGEEAKKLEALSIDTDGSVGISGTVNASNVQELYNVILNVVTGTGTGLYDEENKALLGIEPGAQKNYINSVDETQLNVSESGKLTIKQIEITQVNQLETLLNSKATVETVTSIEDELNALTQYYNSLDERVETLEDRLTWKNL